jgi:hypothetical protein
MQRRARVRPPMLRELLLIGYRLLGNASTTD